VLKKRYLIKKITFLILKQWICGKYLEGASNGIFTVFSFLKSYSGWILINIILFKKTMGLFQKDNFNDFKIIYIKHIIGLNNDVIFFIMC